jgi:hypothetical protein
MDKVETGSIALSSTSKHGIHKMKICGICGKAEGIILVVITKRMRSLISFRVILQKETGGMVNKMFLILINLTGENSLKLLFLEEEIPNLK